MRTCRSILGSVAGGVVITLITGLYSNGLIGATRFGFPIYWLVRRVLAPQYNPWHIYVIGLVVDIVIWTLIIEIIYLAGRVLKKGDSKPRAKQKARRRR